MLDVARLRTLRAVAAHGSITGAAQSLHLTNSAVSQQMTKLEREVGHPLLEAQGRGIRLTPVAERLAEHADAILGHLERAEADIQATIGNVVGAVSIAAFATAARAIVAPTLQSLLHEHPDVVTTLHEMEPDEALPLVERGQIDLAVIDVWFDAALHFPAQLDHHVLHVDIADLAVHANHPLASRAHVAITDIDPHEPWISWPRGSHCHDWLTRTLRRSGSQPAIAHTAMEHSTQLAFVAAQLGTALIPRLGRGHIPANVTMIALDPAPTRTLHAVWRRDAARRPAITATVNALASYEPPTSQRGQ